MRARIQPRKLRTTLTLGIAILGALALSAAGALVALTSLLESSARDMAIASRSVHMAEELEIDLLTHDRTRDERARRTLAGDLRHRLSQVDLHIADAREAALLDRVREAGRAYLDQLDGTGEPPNEAPRAVFTDIAALVALNVDQARDAAARAERLNRIATILGSAIAIALVAGGAVLLVWLRRRALQPVLHIGEAMGRYGRGDRSARAPEQGPAELGDMARRFNDMASALERQQIAQLTFLAGVAHDLRNPLSALRTSAELLGSGGLPTGDRLQLISSVIQRQVERVDRMLGDLLDGARIEAGQLELRPEVCSVSSLVEEIVDLYRSTTQTHAIDLRVETAEPAMVRADPTRLTQVLANLISNGIKYSPGGGTIAVGVEVDGGQVAISVADTGIGIEASDLGRIFEPFQRVGAARDAVPGTGLGLSVVRRIVEAHGGEIRVVSQPGRGSTFEVRLDRAGASASASSSAT